MKKIFFIIFSINLFASNVIDYSLIRSEDKLDLIFKLDSPYDKNNNIKVFKEKDFVALVFKDMLISESSKIPLNLPFIGDMYMYLLDTNTVIKFESNQKLGVFLDNNNQNFELKIRLVPENLVVNSNISNEKSYFDYFFAFIAIVVLLFFVIRYKKKKYSELQNIISKTFNLNTNRIKIISYKNLDKYNKFIVVSYDKMIYKFIIGENNINLNDSEKNSYIDCFKMNYIKENALNSYKEKISKL